MLVALAEQRRGRLADVITPIPGQPLAAAAACGGSSAVRLTFTANVTSSAATVQARHARHRLGAHVRHHFFGSPKCRHFGGGGDFERSQADAVAGAVRGTARGTAASAVKGGGDQEVAEFRIEEAVLL